MSCGGDSIIPLEMLRCSASLVLALSVCGSACSSSRPVDNAKPVASASIKVNPSVVASGMPVELDVRFTVAPDAPPFAEDYTAFIHVIDNDGRMIGAVDHFPPIPTRKWKPG